MKVYVILLGVFALGATLPTATKDATATVSTKLPVSEIPCTKENEIDDLLRFITQPNCNEKCRTWSYNPKDHVDKYNDSRYVREFMHVNKKHALPQGSIFSVFDFTHLKQAKALFNMFYHANDVDTFMDTAYYARRNVNEGLFLYAFSVAVAHRPDTRNCKVRPIYETYPYYFFETETIHEAERYKQSHFREKATAGYKIRDSFSTQNLVARDEEVLAYFMNDIDMNRYYYDYNIRYPFWMGHEYISAEERRGELYYYVHQQLLARYYLERLSNCVGVVPMLEWSTPKDTEFRPSLQYHNGYEFPCRPSHMTTKNRKDYSHPFYSNYSKAHVYVRDFARRIRDAIDLGYVYTTKGEKVDIYTDNGFETVSHMIEGNPDSPNIQFYGDLLMYARHLLGGARFSHDKRKSTPSTLEHFETSMRDPVFYQAYKLLMTYFQEYKMHLQPYTDHDLLLPGVKIHKCVVVDKLRTYFKKSYTDLRYAVFYDQTECPNEPFQVGVEQRRLTHDTFKYRLMVHSDKDVDTVVRVFIGPKYDEHGRRITISENRMNFFEFDTFPYALKAGEVEIIRSSKDARQPGTRGDWQFPERFLLPKGKIGGQTYQMYAIINARQEGTTTGHYYYDTRPLGYPFDRYIDEAVFDVPNSIFQEVTIYHSPNEDDEQNRTTN